MTGSEKTIESKGAGKNQSTDQRQRPPGLWGARGVLREDKYAPGDTSRRKHVSVRYPALYQALLDELDQAVRMSMYGIAVKRAG